LVAWMRRSTTSDGDTCVALAMASCLVYRRH